MEVMEVEEVGSLLEEVQQAVLDPQRFCRTIKLKGFQPFASAENALENVNAISEQMVTDDLKVGSLGVTLPIVCFPSPPLGRCQLLMYYFVCVVVAGNCLCTLTFDEKPLPISDETQNLNPCVRTFDFLNDSTN